MTTLPITVILIPVLGTITFGQEVPRASRGRVDVLVRTDVSCLFSVDGGPPYKSDPSAPASIRVKIGEHSATAVSVDGQDLWEGKFIADRVSASFTISLLAARTERTRKESEAAALRLQTARVEREIEAIRQRTVVLTSTIRTRPSSSDDRDLIIRLITVLEKKYAFENELAENYKRVADNLNSQPRSAQNSGAALAGLINSGFALNAIQNSTLHSERSTQILSCINNLTQELGGSAMVAFHKTMPEVCSLDEVRRFGLSHTTASGSHHGGELLVTANRIRWNEQKNEKDDFSITCAEVRGYGTVRGLLSAADNLIDGNQFYIAAPMKHYAFRAGDRSLRENVLEALRLTCPKP
jgi:hypothetical protein